MSEANILEFTEEQLNAGTKNSLPLLNKGANQSDQNLALTRHI